MRLTSDSYEGHPYLRLQLWEGDDASGWWPCRGKGCSIRMGEAAELAEVLASMAFRLDGHAQQEEPSRPVPARQSRGREPVGVDQGGRPAPRRTRDQGQAEEGPRPTPRVNAERQASRPGFDEFGEGN
jgi:hypothetical protein